jgi:immunity protein 49 of polymorphic toxin system
MDASEVHKELVPEIKDMLTCLAVGYPIRELGDELERLSEYFQALGIAYLLESADQERFGENLVRSGHARRYFLRKSREENNDQDRRLALGRTEAFLDALAAGHLGLAREIADLSIDTWHPDWEYEDDFCYYLFLHRMVRANAAVGRADLSVLLTGFEKALEDGDSPRLDVCKALVDRDTNALRAALTLLMENRNQEMEKARERNIERDPAECVCWARSFISIEGLALLRVAELTGMVPLEPGEELQLCPGMAMLPVRDRDYLDMFVSIEQELARDR